MQNPVLCWSAALVNFAGLGRTSVKLLSKAFISFRKTRPWRSQQHWKLFCTRFLAARGRTGLKETAGMSSTPEGELRHLGILVTNHAVCKIFALDRPVRSIGRSFRAPVKRIGRDIGKNPAHCRT